MTAHAHPLVSCMMPTRGRPEFLRQSHRLWSRQTWPERELIAVVDEDDADTQAVVGELSAADPRVRVVCVPIGTTLGDKRNAGAEAARGEYVCHWDDDDWYSPRRLELQVAPLIAGVSEMNWTPLKYILDLVARVGWLAAEGRYGPHAGTLMFERSVWDGDEVRYPATANHEDTRFVENATRRWQRQYTHLLDTSPYPRMQRWFAALAADDGKDGPRPRIRVVAGLGEHVVHVRHGRNLTHGGDDGQTAGRRLAGLRLVDVPIPEAERGFYRDMADMLNGTA